MSKITAIFKFVIRFFFILIISTTVFVGGYLSFWSNDIEIVEKTIEKVTLNTNLKKNYKIEFSDISERWSMHGLIITAEKFKINSDTMLVNTDNIEMTVDIFKTIESKSLKIKKIMVNNVDIQVLNLQKKNDINIKEKSEIKDFFNVINNVDLEIKNLNIKDSKNKINLKNLNIAKNKFENSFFIYNEDKIKTFTKYELNEKTNIINIHSEIRSNNYYLSKIINHSGQKDLLDFIKINDIYSVIGDLTSNIDLSIDLSNFELKDYSFNIKLGGNKVILNSYKPITLTNAIGTLTYDKTGFHSNTITANLKNKKTNLKIKQIENKAIKFDFDTTADMEKLSEIAQTPLWKILKGSDKFKGTYLLNFDEPDHLYVTSDFKNIEYLTETNLKKESGFELNAYFDYELEKMDFDINQGKNNIELKLLNNDFYNLNIAINKKITKSEKSEGFFINGFLYDLDLFELTNDLNEINKKWKISKIKSEENIKKFPVKINIDLKNTKIKNMSFEDINLLYQNNEFSLLFDQESSIGSVQFNILTKKIDINIEKLKISTENTKNIIEESKKSNKIKMLENKNEDSYLIKINAKKIIIDDRPPLSLKTELNYKKGIIESDNIIVKDLNDVFTLQSKYQYDSNRNITTIMELDDKTPILNVNKTKEIQEKFIKQNSGFESEYIKIYGNMSWEGFEVKNIGKTLKGFFSIDIGEGKIAKDSAPIGLAKTLNIFNFDSWFEMFTFDFDGVSDGLPFNFIKGKFNIKDNVLDISPRIVLDSELFFLEINGEIDYVNSKYALEIDTVVPLINKAPVIALFTGLAPEIVGAIWLVDKIIGEELNKAFTMSSFNINGTFENPVYTESSKLNDYKVKPLK